MSSSPCPSNASDQRPRRSGESPLWSGRLHRMARPRTDYT